MFYGLISVAAGAVGMFQNFEAVEISPGFPVARSQHTHIVHNMCIHIHILCTILRRWSVKRHTNIGTAVNAACQENLRRGAILGKRTVGFSVLF
jgi:hypothetical protein